MTHCPSLPARISTHISALTFNSTVSLRPHTLLTNHNYTRSYFQPVAGSKRDKSSVWAKLLLTFDPTQWVQLQANVPSGPNKEFLE